MAVYTPLTDGDLREIGARYRLTVRAWEPMAHGSTNTNVLLRTDQGPFMLTLVEAHPAARAVELARLLGVLTDHGFPTSAPRPSASGVLVEDFGGKPILVKPYIQGTIAPAPSDAVLRQVGRAMARLHAIPAPAFLTDRALDAQWKATPAVTEALDAAAGADLTGRLRARGLAGLDALPQGLIHGDICTDNILVRDGALVAVIDFEEASRGPRVFDIGMALVGLCRTPGGVDLAKSRAVVEGYETGRRLEAEERAALGLAAEYAALLLACWRFWKFHLDAPDAAQAGRYLEMVRVAEGIRGLPPDVWD